MNNSRKGAQSAGSIAEKVRNSHTRTRKVNKRRHSSHELRVFSEVIKSFARHTECGAFELRVFWMYSYIVGQAINTNRIILVLTYKYKFKLLK